ncbi:MAG: winged helix-turn-helix domain-containing protein [Coriobacteriia bacterium]
MLSTLVTSATRRALLVRFFTHPGERFYATQLIRELGLASAGVQKELARLESAGMIQSEREGNVRFFGVNTGHPLYAEIKSIVYKTEGLGDVLGGSIAQLPAVDAALVFGSVARGAEDASSDVDVLVLGDVDVVALDQALSEAERTLEREVNATVLSRAEWRERLAWKQAFVTDIVAGPKIFLVGGDDELR